MADLTTYSGLQAAVADWLGRDDLTAQIPVFIQLAEKRMNRELRLRVMEQTATAEVPAGVHVVELPERRIDGDWKVFLEMRDLAWTGGGVVRNLKYTPPDDYVVMSQPAGLPDQYTIISNRLYLLPAPAWDGELRLTYYGEIPPLSNENQTTNNVLQMFPDLYLYATLVESGPYTRSSAPVEMWAEYYNAGRLKAEANERKARFTANLAMRPVRRVR